jgi:D-alanyl-D-alanine carboxypeptidase (penicillin-binding protein 5/6)
MTACVVLELAREKPAILDETVVFSRRADETPGSTAGLRVGERIPVREALYGLMLPSGNDAATALAEHFGERFAPPPDAPLTNDPLERFVAEMNRRAALWEMTDTRYVNPHGLTDDAHKSSARDQFKLAVRALSYPGLRDIVGTRQRGCRVEGPGGWRRDVVWKNTNRLLEREGYLGLKTGTTDAAGACLVSVGARDGRELIVVVLGCANSDARYFDTRHLFRWAWQTKPPSN